MNRGRISISVFLCFLMMMLLVVSGCSSSDDAPAATTYTVTFDSQSATTAANPTSMTATITTPATTLGALPAAPTLTGSTFAGWWTVATSGGTEFTASTPVAASITVYARWSTSPVYTVTYDSQGGSAVGAQHVTSPATTVVTLPAAPTKTGYDFGGWYTATSGGGTAFIATTTVGVDITVYAKWNSYTYTVTFNSQSATTPASPTSKTVASPATTVVTLPTPPTKTSYTFAGWNTQADGLGTAFTDTTTVMASITVYAKWTTSTVYTVTFNSQDGTAVSPQQVVSGGTVGTLPTTTRTGYTFGGWYTATSGGGTAFTATTAVTADITVYAKWTATSTTSTASGTWSWNSGTSTLTMNWTSSNFPCTGPSLGTQTMTNPTIEATTMTMYNMTWTRSPAGTAGDAHGTWTSTDSGNTTYTLVISGGTISGTMSLTATITACGSRDYNPGAETRYMPGDSTNKYRVNMWYDDASHSASAVSITGSTGAGITGSQALSYDTTNTSWGRGVNFGNTLPTGLPFTYTFSITDTTTWAKAVTVSCFLSTAPTNLAPSGTIATLTPTFSWTGISAADAQYSVQLQDSNRHEIWRKQNVAGTSVVYGAAGGNPSSAPALSSGTLYYFTLDTRSISTCPDGSSQILGSFTTP